MGARILLVRHGETALNEPPERIRAWLNVPLTAEGIQTSKRTATRIAPQRPVVIFSSDMHRAMQTAQEILKAAGLKRVIPSRNLRPWDVGQFEGESVARSKPALMKYVEHETQKVPGGESFAHFVTRYTRVLHHIMAATVKHQATVVVVTHIRNIRVTLAMLGHGEHGAGYFAGDHDPVEPGGYLVLEPHGKVWEVSHAKS